MKEKRLVPVRVLRGCRASGKHLRKDSNDFISDTDYKVLEPLGKVELRVDALKSDGGDTAAEIAPAPGLTADSPISALALNDRPTKALADNDFETLGDLADYLSQGGDLDEIDGVGQATEAKIMDALKLAGLLE